MRKREFLKGGACALACSSGAVAAVAATPARLHELSGVNSWRRQLGQAFHIDGHALALAKVQAHPANPGLEQFSLHFTGPLPEGLGDGLRLLRSGEGHGMALYLTRTESGLRADFCRLTA